MSEPGIRLRAQRRREGLWISGDLQLDPAIDLRHCTWQQWRASLFALAITPSNHGNQAASVYGDQVLTADMAPTPEGVLAFRFRLSDRLHLWPHVHYVVRVSARHYLSEALAVDAAP